MSSLTTWTRLEPTPRRRDMQFSLKAGIADPLWMLGRQWQFGELSGEDAGSPIDAVLEVEVAQVDRFHAGPVGARPADRAMDFDSARMPLEALVEARPLAERAADTRLRIDAGQHFLRTLCVFGVEALGPLYQAEFPLADIDETERPLVMAGIARRVPDGRALAEALLAERGNAPAITSLPAAPGIPAADLPAAIDAANRFLAWWSARGPEDGSAAGGSWQPRRLEHAFAIGGEMSDGSVVLRADEYPGGHLDWHSFDIDSRPGLGPSATAAAPRLLTRHTMPTRAYFAGMPAERFWEFEDSVVRYGVQSVGRTDIAQLLLSEFALTYGNDWYVIPLTLPTGSLTRIRRLSVKDTFGIDSRIDRTSGLGASGWTMFELAPNATAARRVGSLFFLLPALGPGPEGDPIEEVVWFRDEMANMVWAVEHRLELPTGGAEPARDRYRYLPQAFDRRITGDIGEAELIYRLKSPVPEKWFPMVPVRPNGAGLGVVELELRPITRVDVSGAVRTTRPSAPLLNAADPFVMEEEEVPRDGVVARTHWQLTRSSNGQYHLWLAERVTTGAGEGSSGLVFDVARPVG